MIVLDVGCGDKAVGDVNCDRTIEDHDHHRGSKIGGIPHRIDPRKTPNFVVCDASCLPFIDNCFDMVVSKQVVEHVERPYLMISEMVRTSRDVIIIETMHRRGERVSPRWERKWVKTHHPNKFDFTSLSKIANYFKCKTVLTQTLDYNYIISIFGIRIFPVPAGIRVIWSKKADEWNICREKYYIARKQEYLASLGL
jgi:hypothetical protein